MDPEVLQWLREHSGLRLDRDGRFWHQDAPVEHPKVIALFRRGLDRAEDGRPILRVGTQWCFLEVEDVLFRVRSAACREDGDRLSACELRLDDDSVEALSLVSGALALGADDVLYARVKKGREWARLLPPAHAALGRFVGGSEEAPVLLTVAGELPLLRRGDEPL